MRLSSQAIDVLQELNKAGKKTVEEFEEQGFDQATVNRALLELKEEKLAERAEYLGKIFREEMKNFDSDMIELVRGKGLLNAVIVKPKNGKEAWDVTVEMSKEGILAKPTHQHIIRFAPPLVITEEQLREGIELIKKAFRKFD